MNSRTIIKGVALLVALLFVATLSSGVVAADENYHGEDDSQPRVGAEGSPGDGVQPDDAGDAGQASRTRFKDK